MSTPVGPASFSSFLSGLSGTSQSLSNPPPKAAIEAFINEAKEVRKGLGEIGKKFEKGGKYLGGEWGKFVQDVGTGIQSAVAPTFKEHCEKFFKALGWSVLGILALGGGLALSPALFLFIAIPAAIIDKRPSHLVTVPFGPAIVGTVYCFVSAFSSEDQFNRFKEDFLGCPKKS